MNKILKELKTPLIIVAILCVATVMLQFFMRGQIDVDDLLTSFMYNFFYGIPLTFVNGYFFDYANDKVPWEKQPKRRVFLGVVGSIVLTMATLVFLNLILWVFIWGKDYSVLWDRNGRDFYLVGLIITIIISVTVHAIGFFKEIQREKLISERLRKEKLATELSALRSHVDPHFLFNSFNVLSGLIDEDTDKAQEFLAGLSKIYRYVLEQRNDETTTVWDELAFAKQYLDLQKMRFENSIEVDTKINPAVMGRKLPSLSLQLLLENAIKHNGFSDESPLKIKIVEEDDMLVVTNSVQSRTKISESAGMGLQNINDRYALLSKKEIFVESNDEFFTVKLPLI